MRSMMSAAAYGWLLVFAMSRGLAFAQPPEGTAGPVVESVDRLVDFFRRHPAKPSTAADRVGLYLADLQKGEATLILDEPDRGLTECGSPGWSADGKRIFFDASPGSQYGLTHLKVLDLVADRLVISDLGMGNCPAPSPTGDRVVFLLNAGVIPNAEMGVWIMNADGSDRRRLGSYGRPRWSPNGHQFLIVPFGSPRDVFLIDDRPGNKSGILRLGDRKIFSMPGWVTDQTIVAVIGVEAGDSIALLDVSDPENVAVKEVLWKLEQAQGITLNYPIYSARTGRCYFTQKDTNGCAIFIWERGKPGPPRRLEPEGYDKLISGLSFSPDERYILFSSNRLHPR